MKKIFTIVCAVLMTVFAGCDKLPDAQKIEKLSTSIGFAAGMAVDIAKVSDTDRAAIIEVLDVVDDVVPAQGQTFADAWAPVIEDAVAKLIADGKVDAKAGGLIKAALNVATQGLDYMFEVRWPKAKEYKELVSAGVKGFGVGFKTVITPPNAFNASSAELLTDEEAKAEFDKAREWFDSQKK